MITICVSIYITINHSSLMKMCGYKSHRPLGTGSRCELVRLLWVLGFLFGLPIKRLWSTPSWRREENWPCTTEFYVSLLEKQNKIGEFVGIVHSNFDVEIIQREKIRFGVFGSAKGADVFQMRRRALLVGVSASSLEDTHRRGSYSGSTQQGG